MLSLTVPAYNSLPGAAVSLYIDFNGTPAFNWLAGTRTYHVHGPSGLGSPVPAFSVDGNDNDFSEGELTAIGDIWSDVADKFSPFNINVTTVVPPNFDNFRAIQLIVGGSGLDWLLDGGEAGVANEGGFTDNQSNQAFCFSKDIITNGSVSLSSANRTLIGETIAHEAGHLFGLEHQSVVDINNNVTQEYSDGNALGAPIMGNSGLPPNLEKHGIWFNGASSYRDNDNNLVYAGQQDDLDRLYSLFGPRADDFGQDDGRFTIDDGQGHFQVNGIISGPFDTDGFRFTAIGTTAYFAMNNHRSTGMLTPRLELRSWPNYNPVTPAWTRIPSDDFFQMYFENLVIGQQYVVVASSNFAYGSLGQYFVFGSNTDTFADVKDHVLYINGFDDVNDDIGIETYVSDKLYIYVDNVIGGTTISKSIPFNDVSSIVVNTKSGSDSVRYYNPIGTLPSTIDMGTGIDQLEVRGTDSSDFFDIFGSTVNVDNSLVSINSSVEILNVRGKDSNDTFSVSTEIQTQIFLYGGEGSDAASIDSTTLGSVLGLGITFNGEGGSDGLYLSDIGNAVGRNFNIGAGAATAFTGTSPHSMFYDNTLENLYLSCGSGADIVAIDAVPVGLSVTVDGRGGDDLMTSGNSLGFFPNPFSQNIRGVINLSGGSGVDRLVVDDSTYGSVGGYAINSASVRNTFVGNLLTFDSTLENVDFYGRGGGTTTITSPTNGQLFRLFDGTGGGTGSLILDDRPLATQPFELDLYPGRIVRDFGTPAAFTPQEVQFSGYEALAVYGANVTHSFKVFGTSPQIGPGQQTTLVMGIGADTVTAYPHDAADSLTFPTPLGIGGGTGADKLVIDDTTSSSPIQYLFNNPFGPGTADIFGLGASGIGAASDVETISVLGGAGDDAFRVDSIKSGSALVIDGGGGNDTLDVTPVSQNIAPNITNATVFSFDGGDGSDTFNLHNVNSTLAFTYNSNTTSLQATAGGYGSFTFSHSNTESVYVQGGTNNDVLNAQTVASGQSLSLDGGGGNDSYFLGSAMRTSGVAGGVYVFGTVGTDSVTIDDRADTTGKTLHVGDNLVGVSDGDNLFGPGGFLYHFNIAGALTIKLGSASDTVYAVPHPTVPIFIEANDPTVAAPGDWLGLAFDQVVNPVFVVGAEGEGAYGFDNAAFFYYSGFESKTIDDVAPSIVAQGYDDVAVPRIFVQLSENVSNSLSVYYLLLINTTTMEQVPFAYLEMTYAGDTNTASFTFPGYLDGILPPGEYTATIRGSLTDQFGNQMGAETPFSFTVAIPPPALPGDYNQNGEVDAADFIVWRKQFGAYVPNYSGADGDGNGNVDQGDYDVWRAHFGETLLAEAATEAILAESPPVVELVNEIAAAVDAGENISAIESAVEAPVASNKSFLRADNILTPVIASAIDVHSNSGLTVSFRTTGSDFCSKGAVNQLLDVLLGQTPTSVGVNAAAFEGRRESLDRDEATNRSTEITWDAVDEVFETLSTSAGRWLALTF